MDLESIWDEFDAKLRLFILKRVADEDAAQDILQEVYLKIHSNIQTLRDETKIQSWLYQIARNAIIDHYRKQRTIGELTEMLAFSIDLGENDEDHGSISELYQSIESMINHLPHKYREALVLTEYQGLSQKEMAERLGISLAAAKSRVRRAKAKLRDSLLACCHFRYDRLGHVLSLRPICRCCANL